MECLAFLADLISKSGALRVMVGSTPVHLGGMCKGSGMIHPNMATMLGTATCDAAVAPDVWRGMVKRASMASFNQITVRMCT
jgi:glutamate N-acetyltransferase/amino-acid N-acetyltransferase